MRPVHLASCLFPAIAIAQTGMSQAQLEADCLQRLRPLATHGAKARAVSFSALGNYATYYVVTHRFSDDLRNGSRAASCTYRRDGQWVRDDAAAFKMASELEPRQRAP